MARTGIGDAELARRIGISRLTLIRWKQGITGRPRYREDVVRCAELLRLTPDERAELIIAAGFSAEENAPASAESSLSADPAAALPAESAAQARMPLLKRTAFRITVVSAIALLVLLGAGRLAFELLGSRSYPVAMKGESLIVIAPFVNYTGGQQGYNVRGRLRDEIDREIRAAGLVGARTAEWPEEIHDEPAAEKAGRDSGATIVIWGEYDSGRVVAAFTAPQIRSEPHDQQVVDLSSSPSDLPTTINLRLTEEVRYAALLTLGQLYLERGESDRAKTVLVLAIAQPPSDPDALASLKFRLGRAYQGGELADLDQAIKLFTEVLAVEPRSVDTYNSRALAYLDRGRSGDLDQAFVDLNRAFDIDPNHAPTYVNLAAAYIERNGVGDLDRAIAGLTEAIAIEPDYVSAYVNRGVAYLGRGASGDLDRAFDDLEKALALQPSQSAAYLNRGNAYLDRSSAGDVDRAINDFSRAIALAPDSPYAYFNRGLAYSVLEDWDRSLLDLRRAQELRPHEQKFNSTLCWQLAAYRQPEQALPYCNRALAEEPSGPARDSRGFAYAVMGRGDEAMADFQAFLNWVDASPKSTCAPYYGPSRLAWIEKLERGENPFDAQTLRDLRVRPTVSGGSPC